MLQNLSDLEFPHDFPPFSIRDYVAAMRSAKRQAPASAAGSGCCSSNGGEIVDPVSVPQHEVSSPQLQLFVDLGECEELHESDRQSNVVHGSASLQETSTCTVDDGRRRCACEWIQQETGVSGCSDGIVSDNLEVEIWNHGSADASFVISTSPRELVVNANSSLKCRSPYSDSNIASACSVIDVTKSRSQECSSKRHSNKCGAADAYGHALKPKTKAQHNRDVMKAQLLAKFGSKAIINQNPRIIRKSLSMPGHDESMPSRSSATKTQCPVCMIFQSSSNTTLNAHIDHCLATHVIRENHSKPKSPRCKPRRKTKFLSELLN